MMPDWVFTIIPGWAVLGLGFGALYFAVLRRTAHFYGAGRGWVVPAALTLGRFAGALLFLGLAVRFGAAPLLAAFAGFLVARSLAVRTVRGTA